MWQHNLQCQNIIIVGGPYLFLVSNITVFLNLFRIKIVILLLCIFNVFLTNHIVLVGTLKARYLQLQAEKDQQLQEKDQQLQAAADQIALLENRLTVQQVSTSSDHYQERSHALNGEWKKDCTSL